MFNTTSVEDNARVIFFVQLPREDTIIYEIDFCITGQDIILTVIMRPATGIRPVEKAEVVFVFGDISTAAPECS